MGTLESLWVALDTLRTHKLRSFLTMLGVIFGVMAVVVMVALIEGARASVIEEFEKLGSDVIIVAFDPSERIRREARGGTVEGLTVADLEAIRQLPELRAVAAERQLGQKELIYRGEKVQASLIGVNEDYLTVRALSGDAFSSCASWNKARSCWCWGTTRHASCSARTTPSGSWY